MKQWLVCLAVLCPMILGSSIAKAEDERVYLRFTGDESDTLSALALYFEGPVLEFGGIQFAGSQEMETLYAECRGEIGVSAEEERECRLRAARRVFVEELIEIGASKSASGGWRLTLSVWNTSDNAKVYATLESSDQEKIDAAIEEGLPLLAHSYSCYKFGDSLCQGGSSSSGGSVSGSGGNTTQGITPIDPITDGRRVVSEQPFEGAWQIAFKPGSEGVWTLYTERNESICTFPCTRWVGPYSKLYVKGVREGDSKLGPIDLPYELGYPTDVELSATPELDDDWQDWEVATISIVSAGFVVTMVGSFVLMSGFTDDDGTLTAVGGTLFGVGGVAFSIVGPIYGGYNWLRSDGKDKLIFEKLN